MIALWFGFCSGILALDSVAQSPGATLDTKPAFMQIVTNLVFSTNQVVVTNYVTVTTQTVVTNYYNAQGVLLQPVAPLPGLIPIPQPAPAAQAAAPQAPSPAAPDPAAVKARQLQALRDLLVQGLTDSSDKLSTAGSFTANASQQIPIPQGLTSFDRKKSLALITAMNQTAEKAAPGVLAVMIQTAGRFQPDDPAAVVKDDANAATLGFLSSQRAALDPQVLAVVQQTGAETRLRETYNSVLLKGGGLLGAVLGSGPAVDIEAHVAQGLTQAIANQLAAQEALVRKDPAARKTAALQEVFKK